MTKFLQVFEFQAGKNKKYKIKIIQDNAFFAKNVDGHLLGLYYLISWKKKIFGSHF